MYKIGLNKFMGVGVGEGAEFAVVVGCTLFGMHFSQSKNALLLNSKEMNNWISPIVKRFAASKCFEHDSLTFGPTLAFISN